MNASNLSALRMQLESRLSRLEGRMLEGRRKLLFEAKTSVQRREAELGRLRSRLESGNPSAILERGYGLILNGQGQTVSTAGAFSQGDGLTVVLKDGKVECTVDSVE